MPKINKSNEEWKKLLTPEEFHITREKGTEKPFTGKYWNVFEDGTYHCSNCGKELFLSGAKYDADCGWPSFYEPISNDTVDTKTDDSFGMLRTEVVCKNCGAHLGHVFPDGPPEKGGNRYCINSAALRLKKQ